MTNLNVRFGEKASFPANICAFPPAFAYVGPDDGQGLSGRDGQLTGSRLAFKIIQNLYL